VFPTTTSLALLAVPLEAVPTALVVPSSSDVMASQASLVTGEHRIDAQDGILILTISQQ
jgi:hypothetical protein